MGTKRKVNDAVAEYLNNGGKVTVLQFGSEKELKKAANDSGIVTRLSLVRNTQRRFLRAKRRLSLALSFPRKSVGLMRGS